MTTSETGIEPEVIVDATDPVEMPASPPSR